MSAMLRNKQANPGARVRSASVIRSFVAALAVIAMPATAVASLNAGPAAAATVPAVAAASKVTWHKLTLRNGWKSSQGQYQTGAPAWTVINGIVYLSGSLHQVSGTDSEPAVLPPGARPSHQVYATDYTYEGTSGFLIIYPTGVIYASSDPLANSRHYTSLAAISFPAAKTAQTALSLRNGWRSSPARAGKPAYSVRGGIVYLSGATWQRAGGSDPEIAVLPKAAWPSQSLYITVLSGDDAGIVRIDPNGRVFAYGSSGSRTFTSLGGISYPIATPGRRKLALVNGWGSGGDGTPSYSVNGGVVHLSGSLGQPDAGNAEFAVLPPGARPAHNLFIAVYQLDGAVGTVEIEPNGEMLAYSLAPAAAQDYTSLATTSFPLGS